MYSSTNSKYTASMKEEKSILAQKRHLSKPTNAKMLYTGIYERRKSPTQKDIFQNLLMQKCFTSKC